MTTHGRREALQQPSTLEAARGLGVMYGLPLAVAAWWAGSLVSAVASARRPRGRASTAVTIAGLAAPGVYYLVLRPRWLSWGATPEEVAERLPGDAIVPNPSGTSTRAITIEAAPEEVWRWLVQVGYGRGGWYSYDALEAAAGAGRFVEGRSATRIHPELQDLAPGDSIRLSPWTAMQVAALDAPRSMVLSWDAGPSALMPPSSWAFLLRPLGPNRTRLIVRGRSGGAAGARLGGLSTHLLEVPHFIMERRMMLGLKQRAELAWRARWQPWQIDRILPDTEFRDQIAVAVDAPGERIFQAVRDVTAEGTPLARVLGSARSLPGRLLGRAALGTAAPARLADGLTGSSWVIVAEDPGREIVWAAAGKYHELVGQPPPLSGPEAFRAFDHPDYEKLAVSVRVEPGAGAHERRLVVEHRTHPLSDEARRKFRRAWRLIKPAAALAARQFLLAARRRAELA
jgi:hypothetical protein